MTRALPQLLNDNWNLLQHLRQKLRFQGEASAARDFLDFRDVREFAQLLASRLSVVEEIILPAIAAEVSDRRVITLTLERHAELRKSLANLLTVRPGHQVGGLMSEMAIVLDAEDAALSNDLMPTLMTLPEEERRALALDAENMLDKLVGPDSASLYCVEPRKAPWLLLEEARTVLTALGQRPERQGSNH